MTTINDIENAIRSWCEDVSGRPTYPEPLNGNMPAGKYCTVHVTSEEVSEHQRTSLSDDGLEETVDGMTRITVDVVVLRGDAMATASRLRRSLSSSARYTDLWAIMGYGNSDQIRDLSAIQSANVRPRAEFRWYAYAALSETFTADSFTDNKIDGVLIGINNPPDSLSGCNGGS